VREGHLRRNIFFRRDADGRPIWQDTFEYGLLNDLEAPGAFQDIGASLEP